MLYAHPSSLYCSLARPDLHSFPTRRSSDLAGDLAAVSHTAPLLSLFPLEERGALLERLAYKRTRQPRLDPARIRRAKGRSGDRRSEEHTSELQSRFDLVCRLLLEKKKNTKN